MAGYVDWTIVPRHPGNINARYEHSYEPDHRLPSVLKSSRCEAAGYHSVAIRKRRRSRG
jgi:hypothetical protein